MAYRKHIDRGVFAHLSSSADSTITTGGTYQAISGTFTNALLEKFTNDVTLPTAVAGIETTLINNCGATIDVFPASGDNAGAGVDTATTIATAKTQKYFALDDTTWQKIELN